MKRNQSDDEIFRYCLAAVTHTTELGIVLSVVSRAASASGSTIFLLSSTAVSILLHRLSHADSTLASSSVVMAFAFAVTASSTLWLASPWYINWTENSGAAELCVTVA